MKIDWPTLEDRLFDLAAKDIARFAAAHGNETFYGFALGCNSEYGNVLLCLNTPDFLQECATEYAAHPPNQEAFDDICRSIEETLGKKIFSEDPPTTPEDEEEELRWSLGDWKHQGFNSKGFESGWRSFERAVLDACTDEEEDEETFLTPTQDRFMRAACRVLVRLESEGVFDVLNRTSDFRTYVADHDESDEDSWGRLEMVRNETPEA